MKRYDVHWQGILLYQTYDEQEAITMCDEHNAEMMEWNEKCVEREEYKEVIYDYQMGYVEVDEDMEEKER